MKGEREEEGREVRGSRAGHGGGRRELKNGWREKGKGGRGGGMGRHADSTLLRAGFRDGERGR